MTSTLRSFWLLYNHKSRNFRLIEPDWGAPDDRQPDPTPPSLPSVSFARRYVGQAGAAWAPRTSRPGRAPVDSPSRKVTSPATTVARYPVARWM